ncbi:MAG: HEAT repeat domain-containing protein [Planctomycetaceae bacterium]
MSRPLATLLVVGALLGAGITGFLVVSLATAGAAPRRAAPGGGGEGTEPGAQAGGGAATEAVAAETTHPARVERVGPGAAGLEGSREPFDGPEFTAELSQQSARVLEIIETITKESDPSRRQILGLELETLLRKLGHRVDASTKNRLIELLLTIDRQWRPLVGQALGAIHGDEALARRLIQLGEEQAGDVYTVSALFQAVGQMKVEAVVPDLLAMLGRAHPQEALIVRALGDIGGAAGAQALVARLGQPIRPETRQAIEAVLGNSRDPAVLDAVATALDTPDSSTRGTLLDILGMSRDLRYAAKVRELLETERDEDVRRRALRALGRFGDAASGDALVAAAEQGGPMGDAAIQAIHEIRNPETLLTIASRYDALGPNGRLAIMGAVSTLPNLPEALRELSLAALQDDQENVRNFAASGLGRSGRDDNVEGLTDFLKRSKSPRERSAGFEALLRINTKAAAEAVLGVLDLLPEALRDDYRRRCEGILARRTG